MTQQNYDLAVLGAGPGGYVAALHAAGLGYKTALIEKDAVGGVCLNVGCIPTKSLVASCAVLERAKRGKEFGIDIPRVTADFSLIRSRKNKIVEGLRKGIHFLFEKKSVSIIKGEGRFKDKKTIEVSTASGTEEVSASSFIIATGSHPRELPELPFDHTTVIDSTDALSLNELPKRIVIVGGGYIGCEWASIFSLIGSDVTIVELTERLLPAEDSALSSRLAGVFKRRDVKLNLATKVESVTSEEEGVTVSLSSKDTVKADKVLVAVGRRRNTSGIGLEGIGVKMKGDAIEVDEYLATSVNGVFAIGDVLASPQLAHVASYEARVAVENLKSKNQKVDYYAVPGCIFTHPPVASVGLREDEAKKANRSVKVARVPYAAVGMTHVIRAKEGYLQLVVDEKSHEILGAQIFGEGATDLIGELTLAVEMKLKAEDLAKTIHAHPTMSEIIQKAALSVLDR